MPERTLTDDDVKAIVAALAGSSQPHHCPFNPEEVQFVKTWLEMWKTTRSEVLKWLIKIVVTGIGAVFCLWALIKIYFAQLKG